jgi:putative transposase
VDVSGHCLINAYRTSGIAASTLGALVRLFDLSGVGPAAANFLQQQARFDKFTEVFNNERPHEALDMKCPAEIYQTSPRSYTGLPDIDYPMHDKTIVVTRCGRICLGRKKINFSQVFAGQAVGIKEVHDDIWLVSFMDYDLGYFDLETRVLEPLENPFGPKVLPM